MVEIITVAQAAIKLGKLRNGKPLHRSYILQLINAGRLKAERNAAFNYYEIDPVELDRFIEEDFLIPKARGRNARRDRINTARSDGNL